jgi:negative regulator of replication initiation
MRVIEISTEVFAKIWSQRIEGEESENAILERLLGARSNSAKKYPKKNLSNPSLRLVLWRHDVKAAIGNLGGEAHLKEIYKEVRRLRTENGRTVPDNLEAIVRREIEYNSSDASAYLQKRDWFRSVKGIGSGVWALRPEAEA